MNQNASYQKNAAYLVLITTAIFLMLFPVGVVILAPFIAIVYKTRNPVPIFLFIIICSFSFSIIYSSSDIFSSRDFIAYEAYYKCVNGFSNSLSCEEFLIGFYFLNKLVGFLGEIEPVNLSILFKFIIFFILYLSTYYYINKQYKIKNLLFVVVFSCLLMRNGSIALLYRQSLATVFIVMLVCNRQKIQTFLLYLASISFHITSIVLAPITKYCLSKTANPKLIFTITFILPVSFILGLGDLIYNNSPPFLARKIYFMLEPTGVAGLGDFITGYAIFMPVAIFSFFDVFFGTVFFSRKYNREKKLLLITGLFWMIMSMIVPHSFRLLFPMVLVFSSIFSVVLLNSTKDKLAFCLCFFCMVFVSNARFLSPILFDIMPAFSLEPFFYLR